VGSLKLGHTHDILGGLSYKIKTLFTLSEWYISDTFLTSLFICESVNGLLRG